MTKFIRKLEVLLGKKGISAPEKGASVKGHNRKPEISRSKHVLDNISAQDFTQHTGLPAKYRETIAVFSDIIDAQRNEVCHDTEFDRKSEISRSKHILDNISAQDFTQRTGLPAKYRETIAVFSDIVDARRNEVCHDTEFEFARLLLTRQFKDPVNAQLWNCDHWALLLLWITGYTTLEDMAAVANDVKPHPIR